MKKSPSHIDNAKVLAVADLGDVKPTGTTRHTVAGEEVSDFAALAIAKYDSDSGVYLFYCDEQWNSVTDTYHENWDQAMSQAEFEFGPTEFREV
jgi:hypothetical protein